MSGDPSGNSHRHSRVLIDGTPLLGQRSGVGRYTAALLGELPRRTDVDVTVTAWAGPRQSCSPLFAGAAQPRNGLDVLLEEHAARYTWQACAQATVHAYQKARG